MVVRWLAVRKAPVRFPSAAKWNYFAGYGSRRGDSTSAYFMDFQKSSVADPGSRIQQQQQKEGEKVSYLL
jgi:hypothetical protein